jgi:hypothetical protein
VKILLIANTDWYLYNFRLALAETLRARGDQVVLVSPEGSYVKKLKDLGFRWVGFPLKRRSLNAPIYNQMCNIRIIHLSPFRDPQSGQLDNRVGVRIY